MYKCKKCGNNVPEGNKFCGVCGTKVEDNRENQRIIIEDYDDFEKRGKSFNQKNSKPKLWLILGIALALIAIFIIIKVKNSDSNPMVKTISISDFIEEPIFEGNDEEGTLDQDSLKINRDMLEDKLREKLGEDKDINVSEIIDNFTLSADPIEKLTNGDTVTVMVEMRNKENIQDHLGIRFTNPSREFKVIGLKDLFSLDPFDGFKPKFTGISPKLEIKITNTKLKVGSKLEQALGSAGGYYDVYRDGKLLNEDEDVKIGDNITFKFNQDGIDRLHENAYKPSVLEKEYKVTNKDARAYIVSKEELDTDFFNKIKDQAQSIVKSDLASRNNSDNPNYEGFYFLTPKESGWSSSGLFENYNIPVMYLVYSYNVEKSDKTVKEYTAVEVIKFLEDKIEDNSLEDEETDENETDEKEKIKSEVSSNEEKPEQIIDYENIKKVYGSYKTLDELKLDLVESKLKDYSYEAYDGVK